MAFAAYGDLSDRAIVERAQRGDHRAFTELVGRHDRRLRTLAGRLLRNPERVDDALQEVYIKAFRTIGRFRGDANVGTWLYRITYNTCVDELRRRQPVLVDDDFDPRASSRARGAMGILDLLDAPRRNDDRVGQEERPAGRRAADQADHLADVEQRTGRPLSMAMGTRAEAGHGNCALAAMRAAR